MDIEYDENGEPCLFAGFISNLGRKNYRDNLTGLYNGFELEKRIQETTSHFAMMILNIANFKNINQFYNRHFGDQVLRIVAQNLQTLLHKQTTIYKLDGDEFALILKDATPQDLYQVYEKIQKYAKQEHSYEGKSYSCHFNAGAAFSPHDGTTYSKLRRNCEIALQHSKHYAYGKLTLYNQDIADKRNQTLRVLHALKESINNNFENFSLVFQPKVTSSYHALTGFEALSLESPRFHIGPGFFIQC
ncbi:MAG: diguanylate cyclase domain-containing protein [Longibaculum sp.]